MLSPRTTGVLPFAALTLFLGACASGGAGVPAGADAEALHAGFTRTWELVPDQSATLEEAIRSARSKRAPDIQTRDPRSRRSGTRGALDPHGAPEAEAEQPDRMVETAALQGVMRMCRRLAVTVDGAGLRLAPEGFPASSFQLGVDPVDETMGSLRVSTRAAWEGEVLRVERSIHDGPRVTQRLRLVDGDRLRVEWNIDTGAREMEFVQVFRPVAG